jgi:hypothetical protein
MDVEPLTGAFEVRLEATRPLRGVVRFGNEPGRPFEGWVALAAAVEACVADADRDHEVAA